MKINRSLHIIGAAGGIGSRLAGAEEAPRVLEKSEYLSQLSKHGLALHWEAMLDLVSDQKGPQDAKVKVANWCQRIALHTRALAQTKQFFMVLGGDNTSSMGTWSGVHGTTYDKGPLGLIWIDAHMDSHTFETSETGCLNGMPLAALLGHGDPLFTNLVHPQPKILPHHLCLIGSRSYEKGEHELLKRLGVKIFYIDEVHERGIATVFKEAVQIARTGTAGYGICLDIDVINAEEVPGTGNPEPNGVQAAALCQALTQISDDPRLLGFELVEFNPSHDKDCRTEQVVCQLIASLCLGKEALA